MAGDGIIGAVRWLEARGLLAPEEVDDPRFRVTDHSARVECLEVVRADGAGFVVKRGFDEPGRRAVSAEAATISRLGQAADLRELRTAIPALRSCDSRRGILAIDRVSHRGNVATARGNEGSLRAAYREFGAAMAQLHRIPRARMDPGARRAAKRAADPGIPWPMFLPIPTVEAIRELSPATLDVVRLVQRHSTLREPLDRLRAEWSPSAWTHRDVRSENCLVEVGRHRARIRLIDWETAAFGDPAWDVGAVFGEILRGCVLGPAAPSPSLTASRASSFWSGYRHPRRRGGGRDRGDDPAALLDRSVRSAGAWLVGRLVEIAQERDTLDPALRRGLQFAANVMTRPGDAARLLLGIAPDRTQSA